MMEKFVEYFSIYVDPPKMNWVRVAADNVSQYLQNANWSDITIGGLILYLGFTTKGYSSVCKRFGSDIKSYREYGESLIRNVTNKKTWRKARNCINSRNAYLNAKLDNVRVGLNAGEFFAKKKIRRDIRKTFEYLSTELGKKSRHD